MSRRFFKRLFFPSNTHRTGLNKYMYGFSVDYWAITNNKILIIHKYLMKKNKTI